MNEQRGRQRYETGRDHHRVNEAERERERGRTRLRLWENYPKLLVSLAPALSPLSVFLSPRSLFTVPDPHMHRLRRIINGVRGGIEHAPLGVGVQDPRECFRK